jgi:hypothetical protein
LCSALVAAFLGDLQPIFKISDTILVFQNILPRFTLAEEDILGPRIWGVTGVFQIFRLDESHVLYRSPHIIRTILSRNVCGILTCGACGTYGEKTIICSVFGGSDLKGGGQIYRLD